MTVKKKYHVAWFKLLHKPGVFSYGYFWIFLFKFVPVACQNPAEIQLLVEESGSVLWDDPHLTKWGAPRALWPLPQTSPLDPPHFTDGTVTPSHQSLLSPTWEQNNSQEKHITAVMGNQVPSGRWPNDSVFREASRSKGRTWKKCESCQNKNGATGVNPSKEAGYKRRDSSSQKNVPKFKLSQSPCSPGQGVASPGHLPSHHLLTSGWPHSGYQSLQPRITT